MTIQKDISAFVIVIFILIGNFILSYVSFSFGENAGTNVPALSLMTFVTLLLFFIVSRIEPLKTWKPVPTWFLGLVAIFVISIIGSLAVSYDTYITIYEIIRWMIVLANFFIIANFVYKTGTLSKISDAIIWSADFLVIIGISSFVNSANPGYLRFTSVLLEHNIFAGFLLLPLCIASVSFFTEIKKTRKYFYAISCGLLGGAFILTFSRGAWLSLILAIIIGYLFLGHKKITKEILIKSLTPLLIILGCVSLFAGGLYEITAYRSSQKNAAIGIYNGQVIPGDATVARLTYFKDALKNIKNNPLGVGLGNYADIAQATRDRVENFSFDPHNVYLKLTAETGIVGGLSFLGFVIALLILLYRQNKTKSSLLSKAFAVGIIAILIHNALDVDFTNTANLCLFFLAAGALYGYSEPLPSTKTQTTPLYVKGICVLLILLSILVIPLYMANNISLDATYYESTGKYTDAIPLYKKALVLFPFSYTSHYGLGQVYYDQAVLATGTAKRQGLQDSLNELTQAKHYKQGSSKIYLAESKIFEQLQDVPKAIASLALSVKLDPLNNLDKHVHLAELYFSQKQYADILTLTEKTVSHYPPQLFNDPIWSDPNKETWRADVITLYKFMGAAYVALGDKTHSEQIRQKISEYNITK